MTRDVTLTADDFGLSEAVNEGIERAHRDGVLDAASLMVAGPAAADAVRRARALPSLRVGLHLVVIEGPAVLPPERVPLLAGPDGHFPSDQLRLGVRYFFRPAARAQLAAEIEAQFAAFAATGLTLSHADSHKHMHLHPTIGRLMIDAGRRHGLTRIRVPAEPPEVMAALGEPVGASARMLHHWTGLLRHQVRRAGLAATDHCFGLAWTGHMTRERVCRLVPRLPTGTCEIYFHPASHQDDTLRLLMPDYDHAGELAALLDDGLRALLRGDEGVTA